MKYIRRFGRFFCNLPNLRHLRMYVDPVNKGSKSFYGVGVSVDVEVGNGGVDVLVGGATVFVGVSVLVGGMAVGGIAVGASILYESVNVVPNMFPS